MMGQYRRREVKGDGVELSELLLAGLSLVASAAEEGYLSTSPTVSARCDADSGVLGYTIEVELIGKKR